MNGEFGSIAPDNKINIIEIAHQMNQAGLPKPFIAAAVDTAFEFEGVYDLFKLWAEEDAKEREEIVADIQEMIDDCAQKEFVQASYIYFDKLEAIAKDILKFKDNLRILVDERCGLAELACLTGTPQSTLSQFFDSSTMPRRVTLHKIARALNFSQVEILMPWTR